MAAEMPARVDAVAGAVQVDYPWTEAGSAVTALNEAATALGSQLERRAGMIPALDDWEGVYRTEFNAKRWSLEFAAAGLKEGLTGLASSIVSGAEDANLLQSQINYRAESTYIPGDFPPVGSQG